MSTEDDTINISLYNALGATLARNLSSKGNVKVTINNGLAMTFAVVALTKLRWWYADIGGNGGVHTIAAAVLHGHNADRLSAMHVMVNVDKTT